jgi:segregation and condensation protein B
MRTLQQRGYITEVGRDHGPGQATLFGTSREFLERLGLDSLDDLPPIADLFPTAEVMEALEKTLRAEPSANQAPEPTADDAATPAPQHEDDLTEPVPPAWALEPDGDGDQRPTT